MSVNDSPTQISLLSGVSAKYCADANVFYDFWIPGRKFDVAVYGKLWDHMTEQIVSGRIVSTEEVYRELKDFANPTFQIWLSNHKDHLYTENDMQVIKLATSILNRHPEVLFHKEKKNGADAFLVATAKVYGLTVITEEIAQGEVNIKNGACPKIPDLCDELGVSSLNILGYCAEEGIALGPT